MPLRYLIFFPPEKLNAKTVYKDTKTFGGKVKNVGTPAAGLPTTLSDFPLIEGSNQLSWYHQ